MCFRFSRWRFMNLPDRGCGCFCGRSCGRALIEFCVIEEKERKEKENEKLGTAVFAWFVRSLWLIGPLRPAPKICAELRNYEKTQT